MPFTNAIFEYEHPARFKVNSIELDYTRTDSENRFITTIKGGKIHCITFLAEDYMNEYTDFLNIRLPELINNKYQLIKGQIVLKSSPRIPPSIYDNVLIELDLLKNEENKWKSFLTINDVNAENLKNIEEWYNKLK
ncbi:hypothetical protein J4399_06200 [Candidatus Woesearchaeota archaeon]|nr:hypothetical protein [Candidatus Woesearchaeota archaeon]